MPVARHEPIWKPGGVELDESYRLLNLAELDAGTQDHERGFADVRMAWAPEGLLFDVRGRGQEAAALVPRLAARRQRRPASLDRHAGDAQHPPRQPATAIASCSCRPAAGGAQTEPVADQLLINRARENARPIRPRELQVASRVTKTGYRLAAFVPAVALGGYDPQQHRQLGFTYAVCDRELGLQTFATGPAFPFDEDPTLLGDAD